MPSSNLLLDRRFIRTLQAPQHVNFNQATGRYEISSQAFQPSRSDGGLSGDLEQLLENDGLTALAFYPAVERSVGAATLQIHEILSEGASVKHEPTQTNWYHAGIHNIKRAMRKEWQKKAKELVKIDQIEARRRADEEKERALLREAQQRQQQY